MKRLLLAIIFLLAMTSVIASAEDYSVNISIYGGNTDYIVSIPLSQAKMDKALDVAKRVQVETDFCDDIEFEECFVKCLTVANSEMIKARMEADK